ncbi:MAG TPA: REP-associated tyrosine transposase [Candidatus Brocadiaceae bacterium]
MDEKPHQSSLRKGRVSIPERCYSVTTCIEGKRPLLVPDSLRPLADVRTAQVIENCIRWLHEQKRWNCRGYVVMPDHVHVIFLLGESQILSGVVSSFGKYTAKKLNELSGQKGRVWQHGFYDHCLRDEKSYMRHLRYIYENPVRKGLVQYPEEWPFSAINPNW